MVFGSSIRIKVNVGLQNSIDVTTQPSRITRTHDLAALLSDVASGAVIAVRVWRRVVAQSVPDLSAFTAGLTTSFPVTPFTPLSVHCRTINSVNNYCSKHTNKQRQHS